MKVSRTGFGFDVAARRADDLDKRLLAEVSNYPDCSVIDLGCGAGGAAARLLEFGAAVTGVDVYDFSNEWTDLLEHGARFIQGDIRHLEGLIRGEQFDFCLLQRTIHYLQYDEAVQLLKQLHRFVNHNLHISFSGITSALAREYEVKNLPIEKRFGKLSVVDQNVFGITAPLVLYSEAEAIQLLGTTGWQVEWVRTSDFGNIKIVASVAE